MDVGAVGKSENLWGRVVGCGGLRGSKDFSGREKLGSCSKENGLISVSEAFDFFNENLESKLGEPTGVLREINLNLALPEESILRESQKSMTNLELGNPLETERSITKPDYLKPPKLTTGLTTPNPNRRSTSSLASNRSKVTPNKYSEVIKSYQVTIKAHKSTILQ